MSSTIACSVSQDTKICDCISQKEKRHSLSLSQQGIWYSYLTKEKPALENKSLPKSYAFHLALEYTFKEFPSIKKLWLKICQDHPMLRTTFDCNEDAVTTYCIHDLECPFIQKEIDEISEHEMITSKSCIKDPFDLINQLPWRTSLNYDFTLNEFKLIITVHHIVCDGYSLPLLHNSIMDSLGYVDYNSQAAETTTTTMMHNSKYENKPTYTESKEFWNKQVKDKNLDFHLLPDRIVKLDEIKELEDEVDDNDNDNDINAAGPYGILDITVPESILEGQHKMNPSVSVFSLCATAMWKSLSHMSGPRSEDDLEFPLGVSFLSKPSTSKSLSSSSPPHHENKTQIFKGVNQYSNALPVFFSPKKSDGTHNQDESEAIQMQQKIQMCKKHESYDAVQLARDVRSSTSLFRNGITILPAFPLPSNGKINGLKVHLFTEDDIMLVVLRGQTRKDWFLRLIYNQQKFTEGWGRRFTNLLINQLKKIIGIQQEKEVHQYLSKYICLTEHFDHILGQNVFDKIKYVCSFDSRNNIAMKDMMQREITYAQMLSCVNTISEYLSTLILTQCGGDNKQIVIAILGTKSIESVLAMLAIMDLGHIYMCIDVQVLDQERIEFMIQDSGAICLIDTDSTGKLNIDENIISKFKSTEIKDTKISTMAVEFICDGGDASVNVSRINECGIYGESYNVYNDFNGYAKKSDDLIYIKYTSGTTGKPKGVAMSHNGVNSMIFATQQDFIVAPTDKVLLFSSISFDASVWHIFSAITSGACLVIPDGDILTTISKMGVTVLDTVPSVLNEMEPQDYPGLRVIQLGAESCPIHLAQKWSKWAKDHPEQKLIFLNSYGPTEASVITHSCVIEADWTEIIPIGKSIANMYTFILDDDDNLVAPGAIGYIWVAGPGVSPTGYINRPELNTLVFKPNPFFDYCSAKSYAETMYKTGDIGRLLSDGNIECLGRIDHQVKWHGCRVELSYIENVALKFKEELGVTECVAIHYMKDKHPSLKLSADMLVFYYTPQQVDSNLIKKKLEENLPSYSMPSHFVGISQFSRNSSDKLDRKNLPIPQSTKESQTQNKSINQKTISKCSINPIHQDYETRLKIIWSKILQTTSTSSISKNLHFFEQGGTSLHLMVLLNRIKNEFQISDLSIGDLYSVPIFADQLKLILDRCGVVTSTTSPTKNENETDIETEICSKNKRNTVHILACEGIFPVAQDVIEKRAGMASFWNHLMHGGVISKCVDDSVVNNIAKDKNFVSAFGALDASQWEHFSHDTFNLSRKIAYEMDPQQRLLIECTFQALLASGLSTKKYKIGAFVAISDSTFHASEETKERESVKDKYTRISNNMAATAATRLAYTFDLRGPAMSIQTACSSYGVAMDTAVQYIKSGLCDAAIVATSSIRFPQSGYVYEDGMIFSKSGRCRPFENRSDGITISNASGAIIICSNKILENDPNINSDIEIVDTATSNDGRSSDKVSFMGPSVKGECEVMDKVLSKNNNVNKLAFIETHGTGTKIGDPVEVKSIYESLTKSKYFEKNNDNIYLSSTKANVGHCDTASGFIGIAKSILCLRYGILPSQPDFEKVNEGIPSQHLEKIKIVQEGHLIFNSEEQTDVIVNSFGIGGTNSTTLLRFSPKYKKCVIATNNENKNKNNPSYLPLYHESKDMMKLWSTILLSYHGNNKVKMELLKRWNTKNDNLPDYISERLTRYEGISIKYFDGHQRLISRKQDSINNDVEIIQTIIYTFTGQGVLNVDHTRELYKNYETYSKWCDETISLVTDICKRYPKLMIDANMDILNMDMGILSQLAFKGNEVCKQLLGFIHGIGLYKIICTSTETFSWDNNNNNIKIKIKFIGHSLGEYASRYCQGMLTLYECIYLIICRSVICMKSNPGVMAVLRCDKAETQKIISKMNDGNCLHQISVAASNHSKQTIVAGTLDNVEKLKNVCQQEKIACSVLQNKSSVAYHSHLIANTITYHMYSWVSDREKEWTSILFDEKRYECNKDNWKWMLTHLYSTVNFQQTIESLHTEKKTNERILFIELGDKPILTKCIKHIIGIDDVKVCDDSNVREINSDYAFGHAFDNDDDDDENGQDILSSVLAKIALYTRNVTCFIQNQGHILDHGEEDDDFEDNRIANDECCFPCYPLSLPISPLVNYNTKKPTPMNIDIDPCSFIATTSTFTLASPSPSSQSTPRWLVGTELVSLSVPSPLPTPSSLSILSSASSSASSSPMNNSNNISNSTTKPSRLRHARKSTLNGLFHDDVRQIFFETLGIYTDFHKYPRANFIHLGGDSMSAIELLSKFRKLVPLTTITSTQFFANPTLEMLLKSLLYDVKDVCPSSSSSSTNINKNNTVIPSALFGNYGNTTVNNTLLSDNNNMEHIITLPDNQNQTENMVWLIPPVGGTLFLYQDYISHFAQKSNASVYGFRYDLQKGTSVENISSYYNDQCREIIELNKTKNIKLTIIGISYGGLVAQHMMKDLSMVIPNIWDIQIAMIDTPTPNTLAERNYRKSNKSFTDFDTFKYTFADMFPNALTEEKLGYITTEKDLKELVCSKCNIDKDQYQDVCLQARIYLQDVNAIRNYILPLHNNKNFKYHYYLFYCESPRPIDPKGHVEQWSTFFESSNKTNNNIFSKHATSGNHISMNRSPILDQFILDVLSLL